jgi:hypothetical protein
MLTGWEVGVLFGLGDGLGDALGLGDGLALGDGLGLGETLGDGLGLGEALGDGLGLGEGLDSFSGRGFCADNTGPAKPLSTKRVAPSNPKDKALGLAWTGYDRVERSVEMPVRLRVSFIVFFRFSCSAVITYACQTKLRELWKVSWMKPLVRH